MKRGIIRVFFSITLVFLLAGFISAYNCDVKLRAGCNVGGGEYVLMGLSDATNAHAEFPDTGLYDYVLCCDFGGGDTSCLDSGVNPHPLYGASIPKNKIIGVYASTNSHAEATDQDNYGIDICYKDLVCVSTTEGCPAEYPNEIVNLSATTNAHIGQGTGYNVAICCQIYAGLIGANCKLNTASWQYTVPVLEDVEVEMIVEGDNCPMGTAINFSIYEDDTVTDDFVTEIGGNYDRELWNAVWKHPGDDDTGDGARSYYFEAKSLVSGKTATSPILEVNGRSDLYCTTVSLCSDYTTESECNTDFCDVAFKYDECAGKYSCSCTWNSLTSQCEFTTIYVEDEELECENGFTLCYDPNTGLNYCYPGSTCPTGDEPLSDGDGVCELGEGCDSLDCEDGDQDSCVDGTTCLGGICSDGGATLPQNMTGCGDGYTTCYNPTTGLIYCYPGSICPTGQEPLSNNNGTCDFGEGCSSADCQDGDKDSCLGDAYCQDGVCYSPTASSGNCIYHESTADDCSDGLLEYSWTVEWTGSGAQPSSCQDGSRVIPCPAQIQLPFISIYTLIITIALIALIYYIIIKLRKKNPSRKHKKSRSKK